MRHKKLLLATAALSTAISCGGKNKEPPQIYANAKGDHYDRGLTDAGVDAPPPADATPSSEIIAPPILPVYANTKGALYDEQLVKLRTR